MIKKLFLLSCFLPGFALAQVDLTSKAGFDAACAPSSSTSLNPKNNLDRQVTVICRDLALAKQVTRWGMELSQRQNTRFTSKEFEQYVRRELEFVRDHMKGTRQILEKTQLKPNQGLMLKPDQWQVDMDGDGQISVWEKYLFAIVKPGERPFNLMLPSNDEAYYQQHYRLDARFQLDQSDVLWALAYHQFFEGALNLVLSYQLAMEGNGGFKIKMSDGASMKRAHSLIGNGFATSAAMRKSLLAETDDKDEWIPNPRQKNHVFPLAMDQAAFDIWGRFSAEILPLWAGKTLLAMDGRGGGFLGSAAKLCPQGKGLNVAALFQHPAPYLDDKINIESACQRIDPKHPASSLLKMLEEAVERGKANPKSPEWGFVRYLYWVN